ncbi:MAG TPA: DUF4397 domain-containing protein, partial [Polyangiaceae bacterium LLY-WYZ-15_(1-7)]|nr:DUF4397 domain-containing protein [Polyangiaceae bacterium LLY-WYZ-15_(1-7)]
GTDAGPPAEAFIRVAHLSPNTPPVRVCIQATLMGTPIGDPTGPLPDPTTDDPIPFRGISGYIPFAAGDPVTYVIDVFADPDGETVTDCDGEAALQVELTVGEDIEPGMRYTAAAIGLLNATEQNNCGETFDAACPEALELSAALFEDAAEEMDGMVMVRALHAIPNAPGVDVCFDPDGSVGEMDPVELFENATFGTASDYYMQDSAIEAGSLRIFAHVSAEMDCPAGVEGAEVAELPIPTPEALTMAFPEGTPIAGTYDLGTVNTVFAEGLLGTEGATQPLFVPWIDLPPPSM